MAELLEAVSDKAWSDFSQSDYSIEQWRKSCLISPDQASDSKGDYSLPVREPDGTLNRAAVHAAASRIGKVDTTPEKKKAAAKKLASLYGQLGEDPPTAVTDLAGQAKKKTSESARPGRIALTEATPALADIQQGPATKGRFRALLIKAGWGSKGYYSEEVLKRDGPKIWPAGTQGYLDHPSLTESVERPERSVRDLASVTTTDPVWDPAFGGLAAEVEVFPQWRDLLNEEFAKKVGLSIRAYGVAEMGEAEGRTGPIITELTEGISVDWVTRAGAGGRVLELIESARASHPTEVREGRNAGAWFESRIHSNFTVLADEMYGNGRLSRDERIALSSAIGDGLDAFTTRVTADQPQLYQRDIYDEPDDGAQLSEARRAVLREGHGMTARDLDSALSEAVRAAYGGHEIWSWVRDHTDDWVVFSVEDGSDCSLFQQSYTVDESTGAVTLTGDAVEVRARTTYVPAPPDPNGPPDPTTGPAQGTPVTENAPGSPPADTEKDKEGVMPELTEAQARELTEARDKAIAEAAQAKADKEASDLQLARFRAAEAARPIAATILAASELPTPAQGKVLADVVKADTVPLTDAGALDESAFRTRVEQAVKAEETYLASLAEQTGLGQPRGLGESLTAGGGTAPTDTTATTAALAESYKQRGMSEAAAQLAATGRPF